MSNGDILSLADKIIDILKDKKSIDLNELAKLAKADVVDVKKIVDMFEKEEILGIEYQLTKTQIIWLGDTCPIPGSEERQIIEVSDKKIKGKKYYVSEPVIKITNHGDRNDKKSEEKSGFDNSIKPLNVFVPEHYRNVEHSRIVPTVKPIPTAKSIPVPSPHSSKSKLSQAQSIMNPIKSLLATLRGAPRSDIKGRSEGVIEDTRVYAISDNSNAPASNTIALARPHAPVDNDPKTVAKAMPNDARALSSELRETLLEVQSSKQELSALEAQRARFFEEKYEPLTKQFDAEISAIIDTIIAKEKEITLQKERAKALIEKIDAVETDAAKMRDAEMQARNEFEKAMVSLEKRISRLREVRRGLSYQVKTSKKILLEQTSELKNIDSSIESLIENEREVERKISLAKARIAEEERGLEAIRISLNEARKTREAIKRRMDEIYEIFSADKLREMEDRISSIAQIESKLEACRQEYLNTMADLKKSSRESAEAVERLREIIRANFARKAASELETAENKYEERMSDAFEEEKDLIRRIDTTRKRLESKIKHAKDLARRLKEIAPSEKEITDAKMMQELKELERLEERKLAVEEGKSERDKEKRYKIIDDIRGIFLRFKKKMQNR
ncbi:MAG: hypothetical protein QW112_01220 [Candidatus Micrarchaeia archaeon]